MKSAMQLLERQGGRVVMFSSSLCSKGVGPLKNRNVIKQHNTDKEGQMYNHTPEHNFYTELGHQGIKERVCFDLYLATPSANESVDLASMSQAVKITGGDLTYLSKWSQSRHGEKLYFDLFRNLTKATGSDVQIKARVSTGLSITQYFGGFGN